MTPPASRSVLTGILCASALTLSGVSLWALHPQNAGPQEFEIKFKLPAPKPLTPEEELATFKRAPGVRAELVAAEPLVDTPVAMCWDDQGRM